MEKYTSKYTGQEIDNKLDSIVSESKQATSGGTDTSLVTTGEKYSWNNKSNFSGNYSDLTNKPTIPDAPSVIKLASGSFTSYTAKSIATLISEGYSYVRLTGYSQYADKYQVSVVVKLTDVQSGTVEIDKAIVKTWTDPLYFYIFNSNGNLAWNGGENHAIYVTLIEGIK